MELVNRDLKCIFCRATMIFLVQDQAYLRDQGFKHDPRFCDGCKCRPEWSTSSSINRPHAG